MPPYSQGAPMPPYSQGAPMPPFSQGVSAAYPQGLPVASVGYQAHSYPQGLPVASVGHQAHSSPQGLPVTSMGHQAHSSPPPPPLGLTPLGLTPHQPSPMSELPGARLMDPTGSQSKSFRILEGKLTSGGKASLGKVDGTLVPSRSPQG